MLSDELRHPLFFGHWLIGHEVVDIVSGVDRLRWLSIATIKQCGCSRNSRSSWRFWIAHYLRKRFEASAECSRAAF